jgi:hypothetical protein
MATSITSLVAFGTETNSSLPAIWAFGVYASVGTAFDFFYQVTFFVAWVTLDARRQVRHWQFQCVVANLNLPATDTDTASGLYLLSLALLV